MERDSIVNRVSTVEDCVNMLALIFPIVGLGVGGYFLRRAWRRFRKPIGPNTPVRYVFARGYAMLGLVLDLVVGLWFVFIGVLSALWLAGFVP